MIEVIASLLLLIAAVYDFKIQRIPNRLQVISFLAIILAIAVVEPESWKIRAGISFLLVTVFLILKLLKQSGGGDFKMMFWFGAGFGIDAFGGLVFGMIFIGVWGLGRVFARRPTQWLPLAPALVVGMFSWQMFIVARHF